MATEEKGRTGAGTRGEEPGHSGDEERFASPVVTAPERELEGTLRPRVFDEFIGQRALREQLEIFLAAARAREESLDHVLLVGPPGLGKTTLATIIAEEMNVEARITSGPVIERPGDLAGMLTNLEDREVLFIDEIHRLNRVVEEYLYPAMEDFRLDIILDKGPGARSVRLHLARFTLVGATTRAGMLTSPLRSRFGFVARVDFYPVEDLCRIVERSAAILGATINAEGAEEIARRARGTPRIANRLLRRVRDYAEVRADGRIDRNIAAAALDLLAVDAQGLDEMDLKILGTILGKFRGGPVGLNTIAAAVGEEAETIEEVYEPYLVKEGFLDRTPRGRVATRRAADHLDLPAPSAATEPSPPGLFGGTGSDG